MTFTLEPPPNYQVYKAHSPLLQARGFYILVHLLQLFPHTVASGSTFINFLVATEQPERYLIMTKPTTCCGRGDNCVCATEAKCSCGQQPAMNCTCEKKTTENTMAGPRCSCSRLSGQFPVLNTHSFRSGARPAGECTCDRASTENQKIVGNTCVCGQRAAGKHE
jgi:hypothetical protein